VKGRGFNEGSLLLSALPYTVAACANLAGGMTSDALVRRLGVKWGRRSLGIIGLGSACLFTIAVMFTRDQVMTIVLLTLVYAGITFQQSGVFAVCLVTCLAERVDETIDARPVEADTVEVDAGNVTPPLDNEDRFGAVSLD